MTDKLLLQLEKAAEKANARLNEIYRGEYNPEVRVHRQVDTPPPTSQTSRRMPLART